MTLNLLPPLKNKDHACMGHWPVGLDYGEASFGTPLHAGN